MYTVINEQRLYDRFSMGIAPSSEHPMIEEGFIGLVFRDDDNNTAHIFAIREDACKEFLDAIAAGLGGKKVIVATADQMPKGEANGTL